MKRLFTLALVLLAIASCKQTDRKALLPNVSGKAGEVVVMLDKANWDGVLGDKVREVFADDCPYFATREPLYTLINVIPSSFSNMFKVHRNILYFVINPENTEPKITYLQDMWANPQCVIQFSVPDTKSAIELIDANRQKLISALEQAERDRVIRNTKRYQQADIFPKVAKVFGGSIYFPSGYQIKKINDNFAWISYEPQNSILGILIYKYPATEGEDEFTLDRIIQKRNEVMRENVPGMFDGTYMTTGGAQDFPPYVEYVKYKGREFAQTRGYWEVEGDFMGGPFVSESFFSKDGKDIIVTEAFLYHPNKDKRLYLRQIESLLYSWEWVEKEDEK